MKTIKTFCAAGILALTFALAGCLPEPVPVAIYVTNSSPLECDRLVTVEIQDVSRHLMEQGGVGAGSTARFSLPSGGYRVRVVCPSPGHMDFWYPLQQATGYTFRDMSGTVRLDFNGGAIRRIE
ncbi:MAG: hypothetical protein FWB79_03315 [Treponema sp.]|nr:hypothetical protein [Treponema sp.]